MDINYSLVDYQKQDLIKYCYLDDNHNFLREPLIALINMCNDDKAINFLHRFFIQAIYPYYTLQRTVFDKVRAYFMRQAMSALLQCSLGQNGYKQAFFDSYCKWCNLARVNYYIQTKTEYQQILIRLTNLQSILNEISMENENQLKLGLI